MTDRSETPRTDAENECGFVGLDFARTLERELQAANARCAELESCPECGHPVSEHCDSRVVGCQHGNGTAKNPLCGCRILVDEMLAVRHFRGLYDKELATLRTQLSEAKAEVERLRKGEYICQKCGLRKDAEFEKGDF